MDIPQITLSARDIMAIGRKIAELKDSIDINPFIIDSNQPFYLQDRSDGGPYEVICIIPQPETAGGGELRATQDHKWLTHVVGCVIGNLDPFYLESISDIKFTQSDKTSLSSLFQAGYPKVKVSGIPTSFNDFIFDDTSRVIYALTAHITMEDSVLSYFEFTVLRMNTRYVVVADYSSED